MAKVVSSYDNEDGHKINVYESGAEYNTVTKRLCRPADKNIITSETAKEIQSMGQRKKQELLKLGALEAVERSDWLNLHGPDAWIVAIGHAQAIKATTPEDPKATAAANFMKKETGLSIQKREEDPVVQATGLVEALTALVGKIRGEDSVDVVEGSVSDG
jgi:hypothetical protein